MSLTHRWSSQFGYHFFIFLFLIGIACVTYYPVFSFTFFQDDFVWLSSAQSILAGKLSIFNTHISHFFMPTIYAYFTGAYALFSTHAQFYYATNTILHTVNAFLLYLISQKLFQNKFLAFLAALLFAGLRYPQESISWISAVTVLITAMWLLTAGLSWLLFLETRQKRYYALSSTCAIFLFLTKEWSVLLVPFLLLLTLLYSKGRIPDIFKKPTLQQLAPFILLTGIYILLRNTYFKEMTMCFYANNTIS